MEYLLSCQPHPSPPPPHVPNAFVFFILFFPLWDVQKRVQSGKESSGIKKKLKQKRERDENPEGQSTAVNIFLLTVNKVHWDIKSIINITLKPV